MKRVILIPGDGIGPEVTDAALEVLDATGAKFCWERWVCGQGAIEKHGTPLPREVIDAIREAGVAFKGPITTPIGTGFKSVNVGLRVALGLYANMRPLKTWPGIKGRYENVDVVVARENIEDVYQGKERWVDDDTAECLKIITRGGSTNIARFAFEYARKHGRRKVSAIHKANIMKITDGLFLECCRKVALEYPEISYDEYIIDNCCMRLVQNPEIFDVLLCENLYGDILSDLAAGLTGGLGLAPGMNVGAGCMLFEPAHGSAPTLAGKNRANPSAMILSGAMLLENTGYPGEATAVKKAFADVLEEGTHTTPDVGGKGSTSEMGRAIADRTRALLRA